MYTMQYYKETQEEESKFTSNVDNTIEDTELENVPSSIISSITQVYHYSMAWPKQTRSGQMYIRCC